MWLFTQTGFVSAVRHYSEADTIVVRARDKQALEGLVTKSGGELVGTPTNDYPYRVHVSELIFKEWLIDSVTALDYTNYKDRMHDTRGDEYGSALMEVWDIMHDVEDSSARKYQR